ncbi:hypothetical protein IFM89_013072 [Coptis chinensis]|uniref:Uncharacterized protein n=1 Tax=Coptis chinensis TaxID=261450 RepID=A0A835HM74_9MAGN|nr:hypothetical protein IFM89_013072 [Coptis chinensis]
MDEEEASKLPVSISGGRTDSLYPMYFSVSCAFMVLKLMSRSDTNDEQWSQVIDKMLQGSANLLGLLVWTVQRREVAEGRYDLLNRLEKARIEVEELKKQRSEDAKATEKVVSIYATRQQSWFTEKRQLKQQLGALVNELQITKIKKEEIILNLTGKVQEKELMIQSKDKALEEAEAKRKEGEEKSQRAEAIAEEFRETIKKEAQKHNSDLWKHKTTFLELVSNQRQLEAEMGRALRQVEVAKHELDSVIKKKDESVMMVQQLSKEVIKMRKDSEQKDKILSAMLRKSKLDTAEKEMLLKEVRISNVKRKQAELEMQKYRTLHESIYEKSSSRSNLLNRAHSRSEIFSKAKEVHSIDAGHPQNRTVIHPTGKRSKTRNLLLECMEVEHTPEHSFIVPDAVNVVADSPDHYPPEKRQFELITTDVKQLKDWVCSETEKITAIIEQRHRMEIDAFAEQLRIKEENLEAFRWRILSNELESKRLHSHTEELEKSLSQLMKEKMKLEALLGREAELKSLNKGSTSLHGTANWHSSPKDQKTDQNANWSEVKIIKTKPCEEELPLVYSEKEEKKIIEDIPLYSNSTLAAPEKDIEVEKEVTMDTGHGGKKNVGLEQAKLVKLESNRHCLISKDTSTWKMDLHSQGVSYNIKRLKQQLLLLNKLVGISKGFEDRESGDSSLFGTKGFNVHMSLLNKQVCRYQSLQEKIDDLCKRMHENYLDSSGEGSRCAKTTKETKTLEMILEETFLLQRYMVATGQKLMEIQPRIASGFTISVDDNRSSGIDMKRFGDSVRTLFRDVQRGLEVRIARIIGDLGGTLTCDGITHFRR